MVAGAGSGWGASRASARTARVSRRVLLAAWVDRLAMTEPCQGADATGCSDLAASTAGVEAGVEGMDLLDRICKRLEGSGSPML